MKQVYFTDCVELVGEACKPYSGSKKYVSTGAVNIDHINEADIEVFSYDEKPSRANLVAKPGDILFAKMMCTNKTLQIDRVTSEYIFSTGFFAVRAKNELLTDRCLYYLLTSKTFLDQKDKNCSGATQKAITNSGLNKIQISIPPLTQQASIVSAFDKLFGIIKIYQKELNLLDELIKTKYVEMFGNFVYENNRWQTCKVGDVADTIDPQPSHRTPPVASNGIPYVGIAECNYQTQCIDFDKARKVSFTVLQEHMKRYTLDDGDFIIGKIGTIGKPFFLPAKQTYALSANTVLIKPIKGRVVPQFLFSVFQSEYMDRIIDAEKKSTSQPAFGIQKVRQIQIPFPPLDYQNRFASYVDHVNKMKAAVQRALDEAQLLFDSLMQKYFG